MATLDNIAMGPAAEVGVVRTRGKRKSPRERARLRQRRLSALEIRRSPTSDAPVWILVGLLAFAGVGAALAALTGSLTADSAVALAAVVVTVAGLLVALLQWRNGLAEKAFDALYERIAIANDMRLEVFEGLDRKSEPEVAAARPELYRFFVYTEIDSFEFAVRRYQFGLGLNADIVDRALRHFEFRCKDSETFRRVADECIDGGAYFDETKTAVEKILEKSRRQ